MDAMTYIPCTLFYHYRNGTWTEVFPITRSPQVCTLFSQMFPLWKIISIPDFRLSDSPPGAEVGLLGIWKPETSLVWSPPCASACCRAATPGAGGLCACREPQPPEPQLLKEPGLPRARNSTWQCWGTPNTGPAPVCRDSLGRAGKCSSSIHTGEDTTHVGLCSTSLKH